VISASDYGSLVQNWVGTAIAMMAVQLTETLLGAGIAASIERFGLLDGQSRTKLNLNAKYDSDSCSTFHMM
jgi:hypothetical protein